MIAPVQTMQHQIVDGKHQEQFLEMLPLIRGRARQAFRRLDPESRQDLIQETIANAFCAFVSLVRRGKANIAYATPLANFAIRQAIAGRRVGSSSRLYDVTSPFAYAAWGIFVERLDGEQGEWRAALVEDRRASPADIAAARIDVAAWFGLLALRDRQIAMSLAMGGTTSEVARQFGLSAARVSQIRGKLRVNWETFQGDGDKPRSGN